MYRTFPECALLAQSGLDKLAEAASKVDALSAQASSQRTLLAQKQTQAEAALQQITAAMQLASASKNEVTQLQVRSLNIP
jgi:dynein heavy chain 2